MDAKKLSEVIARYRKHFESSSIPKQSFSHEEMPGTSQDVLSHCHSMLAEMEIFVQEGSWKRHFAG